MENGKLIILGLDGATFRLITPWIKEGKLKNFEKMIKGGVWGELESTCPPLTCPAWPSFMLGKNPGKFGINDFIIQEKNMERLVSFFDILGEPFWDIAGREGCRSIIINVPVTYPPRVANGILLSGMMTPPGRPFWSHKEIMENGNQSLGDYILDLDIFTLSSLNREKSLKKLYTMIENRFRWMMHLKDHYPFDLMVTVFRAPDIVCHRLWDRPDVILRVYEMIDEYLRAFMNGTDTLFLMSDHGFGSFSKGIRINQYFHDLGILTKKKADFNEGVFHGSTLILKQKFGADADWVHRIAAVPWRLFLKFGLTRSNISHVLKELDLYDQVRNSLPRVLKKALPISQFTIDREKSKVYLQSRRTRGVIINSNGKDCQEFRDFIRRCLLDLRDPETGQKVIRHVFKREEIYWGDYADTLPDLYIEPEEGYILRDDFGDHIVHKFPSPRPNHDSKGIFIAFGRDISIGKQIEGMDITDIAPTALHLLNIAIPKDMDGRVVKDIFKTNSDSFKRRTNYSSVLQRVGTNEVCLSQEDESAIKESLRALGYID